MRRRSPPLARIIRERRATEAGIGRSNVGGWHSTTDMLDWGGPAAAKLADLATKSAIRLSTVEGRDPRTLDWSVKMWANVSPPGGLDMSHSHPGVLWAAVYTSTWAKGAAASCFSKTRDFPCR